MSRGDVSVLLKRMRAYRQAHVQGTALPMLPKMQRRKIQAVAIWALFRVSLEQPGYFALGIVCAVPSLFILTHQAVQMSLRFINKLG